MKTIIIEKYGATWCGPCRILEKTLDAFVLKHPEITVIRYDVDDFEEEELKELNISQVPVLRFIDENGNELHRLIGAQSLETIENELS